MIDKMTKRKEQGQMKNRQIRFPDSLWAKGKAKAGITPLSAVIRKLLEMWIAGKIDLDK